MMKNLLEFLYSTLSTVSPKVYFESVPDIDPVTQSSPTFPYLVYRCGSSANIESYREDFPFVVNVWDRNPDTTNLEELSDMVDRAFKDLIHIDENQQLTFVKEGRSFLSDPDPSVKGRQIRYTVKVYDRRF